MRIVCWQTILMKYHTLFFRNLGKMLQNLLSAAVVIGALRLSFSILGFPNDFTNWPESFNTNPWIVPGYQQPKVKRSRCHISLAEKYEAIMEMEKGNRTKSELARMFNVPQSTFFSWVRNADSIKQGLAKYDPKRSRMRAGTFAELEGELYKWCCTQRDVNIQLSGSLILEKAKEIVDRLNLKKCKLSPGWLERFKERHGISFKKN